MSNEPDERKSRLEVLVTKAAEGLLVSPKLVIDNLLDEWDESNVLDGSVPVWQLRAYIQTWLAMGSPKYSEKVMVKPVNRSKVKAMGVIRDLLGRSDGKKKISQGKFMVWSDEERIAHMRKINAQPMGADGTESAD